MAAAAVDSEEDEVEVELKRYRCTRGITEAVSDDEDDNDRDAGARVRKAAESTSNRDMVTWLVLGVG